MTPGERRNEKMYSIKSIKAESEIEGTLVNAINAAISHEKEYQPSFGVDVIDDAGEVVAHIEDGKITD